MKKFLALLLALTMVLAMAACSNQPAEPTKPGESTPGTGTTPATEPSEGPTYEKVTFDGQSYTYHDATVSIPTNWNPHTYQTKTDSYPLDYVTDSLFTLFYNDELHPVEGKNPYEGYKVVPSMAADYPVDVTAAVKAEHPEFNIPEDATTGYAWSVKLRDDLKWDNGDPITAQDFVDSLERVLRGELLNYRAADYYDGSYVVVNADKYSLRGTTTLWDNGDKGIAIADMQKNDEGQYMVDGEPVFIGVGVGLSWTSGNSLADYVDNYGDAYFGMERWEELKALMDEEGKVPANDETLAILSSVTTTNPEWGETDDDLFNYLVIQHTYDPEYSMEDGVGLYVSGDNELTFVYRNAVEGFYLMTYAMGVPLVKIDLYDSLLTETDGVWSSTYNTNVETSASYGPYKVSDYQMDKSMHFVKNENWYGWNSGNFTYVDPTDGKQYDMYQTTDIDLQYVKESATQKTMFLSGQLAGYGLGADDFDQYRSSEYCYATPGQAVFGMILNGYMDMLKEREAAADFDQKTTDLEMMSVTAFKKALAVSIDRDDMCASVSPARSAGFGLIGTRYVYDPETGALYRDSDQAKQTLCDFYSVDPANFGGDLDKAVASITGFDPVAAGALFKEAFDEGIKQGYITDEDGDGKSDQTVTMQYALSGEASEFMEKTLAYMNESVSRAAEGTPFEGKIKFVFSAVLGDPGWSDAIRGGTADVVLAGWSGATMDPFGFADTWTNANSYWNAWFDATKVDVTITVNGEEVTMTLRDWALCLQGEAKTINDKTYNFGYGQVDVDTRLDILAACEKSVLGAYVTLPMLADGSMALLSQQLYYVVEEFSPIMNRGGIQYMKYNYSDAEWEQYVADQGGTLQY